MTHPVQKQEGLEKALTELQELRAIVDRSPVMAFVWRIEPGVWPVEFVSGNVLKVLGYSADDLMNGRVSWVAITHSDDVARLEAEVARHLAEGRREWSQEYRLITKSGEARWFRDQNLVLCGATGQPERIQSIVWDETERKRTEDALLASREALRANEARYRLLAENITDVIWTVDLELTPTYVSPSITRMSGFTVDEELRMSVRDTLTAASYEKVLKRFHKELALERRRLGNPDRVVRVEVERRHKGGYTFWVEYSTRFMRDAFGNPVGLVGVTRDITERKRAEDALRHGEETARALMNASSDIAVLLNTDGVVIAANETARREFSVSQEEVVGKSLFDFLSADRTTKHRKDIEQVVRDRMPMRYEEERHGRHIDYSFYPVIQPDGVVECVAMFARDMTGWRRTAEALRRSEEQLWHSQKMEAVGELAGHVAHDFNNFLTAINGYAEFVMMKLGLQHELFHDVERIRQTTARAAELTRKLLQLSDRHHIEVAPTDVNREIADMVMVLRHLVHEGVKIRTVLAPEAWTALADPGSLHQVVMNLAINASNAMPGGGTFEIRTGNAQIGEDYCRTHPEARPGQYLRLTVSDTGAGIDESTLRRIFEPFFTTREPGKGMGLGLSAVYGIVRQHRGWLTVRSQVDGGTTFDIHLPAVPDQEPTRRMSGGTAVAERGGGKRLLVVEDEPEVRTLAARAFREHGYVVDEAPAAEEALRMFLERGNEYDLVFSDILLPGMTGIDLAEELIKRRADLPIVLTSGWTGRAEQVEVLVQRGIAFIPKPYDFGQVLEIFRRQLAWHPRAV